MKAPATCLFMLMGIVALVGCNAPSSDTAETASPDPDAPTAVAPVTPEPPAAPLEDMAAIKEDIAAIKGGEFVGACLEASNLEEPICQCLSAKASEMLTPDALKFLVATLKQDTGTANTLRTIVPPAELAEAGIFMVQETAGCAAPQ